MVKPYNIVIIFGHDDVDHDYEGWGDDDEQDGGGVEIPRRNLIIGEYHRRVAWPCDAGIFVTIFVLLIIISDIKVILPATCFVIPRSEKWKWSDENLEMLANPMIVENNEKFYIQI